METYQMIQVSGGKMHRPAETSQDRQAWGHPMPTVCRRVVTPLNVFVTERDALDYTGGRPSFLCKQCGSAAPQI